MLARRHNDIDARSLTICWSWAGVSHLSYRSEALTTVCGSSEASCSEHGLARHAVVARQIQLQRIGRTTAACGSDRNHVLEEARGCSCLATAKIEVGHSLVHAAHKIVSHLHLSPLPLPTSIQISTYLRPLPRPIKTSIRPCKSSIHHLDVSRCLSNRCKPIQSSPTPKTRNGS
jgi:hypothetical protein